MSTTDTSEAPASSNRRIGETIDNRYTLRRCLGRGNFGEVFEASQEALNRLVVLKFLRPEVADHPEVVKRFRNEARAAGSLKNENIIAVYDSGAASDGSPYIAMEHCDGLDCARLLERTGRLPAARAIQLASQVCSGLYAAHANGIVHRDLKPANLLLTQRSDGSDLVKILDFGIAKLRDATSKTRSGAFLGTLLYASPEQIEGARDLDHRSDVYSLSAIVYEFLCGHAAFEDAPTQAAFLYQALNAAPIPLAARVSGLPRGLSDVVARGMAKRPGDRFADMASFANALRDCSAPAPVSQESTQAALRPRNSKLKSGRNKELFATLYAPVIALVMLISLMAWLKADADPKATVARAESPAPPTAPAMSTPVVDSGSGGVAPKLWQQLPHVTNDNVRPIANLGSADARNDLSVKAEKDSSNHDETFDVAKYPVNGFARSADRLRMLGVARPAPDTTAVDTDAATSVLRAQTELAKPTPKSKSKSMSAPARETAKGSSAQFVKPKLSSEPTATEPYDPLPWWIKQHFFNATEECTLRTSVALPVECKTFTPAVSLVEQKGQFGAQWHAVTTTCSCTLSIPWSKR
jgi:serine/threonine protein kinase